jgi:hypothetical protein
MRSAALAHTVAASMGPAPALDSLEVCTLHGYILPAGLAFDWTLKVSCVQLPNPFTCFDRPGPAERVSSDSSSSDSSSSSSSSITRSSKSTASSPLSVRLFPPSWSMLSPHDISHPRCECTAGPYSGMRLGIDCLRVGILSEQSKFYYISQPDRIAAVAIRALETI